MTKTPDLDGLHGLVEDHKIQNHDRFESAEQRIGALEQKVSALNVELSNLMAEVRTPPDEVPADAQ